MLKYPSSAKMMSMTTKIETISFALILRPSRWIQRGWNTKASSSALEDPFDLSVSSMDRHRDFCESRFAECRDMCLLLREDRQVLGHRAEDGKTEREEHRGDHHFRPLRGIARARAFDSGNGDVQTIGHEAEQRQHGRQIKALRAFANPPHQQQAERRNDRQEDLQEKETLLIARHQYQLEGAAVVQVLKAQNAVQGKHHNQRASQVDQDR